MRELSPRETEVMRYLAEGRTLQETADEMGVTHATVKTLLGRILLKLDAKNRAQAVFLWMNGDKP